jgi:hypothetical protein
MPTSPPVVQVTVVQGLSGPVITVNYPVLNMSNQGLAPQITWTIVSSPGWTFQTNGIVFADTSQQQFSHPLRSSDGLTFNWTDANTDSVAYNYTIYVVHDQFGEVLTHDPVIQNENS